MFLTERAWVSFCDRINNASPVPGRRAARPEVVFGLLFSMDLHGILRNFWVAIEMLDFMSCKKYNQNEHTLSEGMK
jgi:hypothetical protein